MRLIVVITICSLHSNSLFALTWRVPGQAPTIQAAFDSSSVNDTVLVDPGLYTESLVSPSFPVALIGAASPFGQTPVIVNPSGLVYEDSIASLLIQTSGMTVDSILFRNGASMFPRDDESRSGGVVVEGSRSRFYFCRFDSVHVPIWSEGGVTVERCEFQSSQGGCVWVSHEGFDASLSVFSGIGYALVISRDFTRIDSCLFFGTATQHLLLTNGEVAIRGNDFGPFRLGEFIRIALFDCFGAFAQNRLHDWEDESHGALLIETECNGEMRIQDNLLTTLSCRNYTLAVETECADPIPVQITGNRFSDCTLSTGSGKAITVYDGSATLSGNTFSRLFSVSIPAVHLADLGSLLRRNIFSENGTALDATFLTDARFNFWGDSSGPFHPTLNPDGLGDAVSDSVIFEPWYPDTSFLIDAADERRKIPSEFMLSVYPNPFNSSTHIELFVPDPFIGSITLSNVLGQQVREIHRGPLYGHEQFTLTASALPSGVYFISVRNLIQHSTHAVRKIAVVR